MLKIIPAVFSVNINNVGSIIGTIAAVIALIGGAIGLISATPAGDELSSATGIVHETQQQPADIAPRDDLKNEEQIPWSGYQVVTDNSVRVFFSSRSNDCYGYRTEVVESANSVTIKVFQGSLPQAPEVCTLIGSTSSIVVHLDSPLGGRRLKN